jgi:formate dehydrogenase gamma subunit
MTLLKGAEINEQAKVQPEEIISIEQIKKKAVARKMRAARTLAAQLQIGLDGSRTFIRFSRAECGEHQILLVTFTILAVTGLLQRYSQLFLVGVGINVLGGVDAVRTVHHLAAVVLILQSLYHAWLIVVLWAVNRERGSMWPYLRDFLDLVQMVKFNLGLAKARPEFDRFSIEEKLEYWALLWGMILMIVTGVIMWFPTLLPGDVIPISRALHGWEAILAILAILTWHMYHTVIKEQNRSIFSGTMTEAEMQHGHPLEYRRILAAHEYLQKIASRKKTKKDNLAHSKIVSKETRHEVV